MDHRRAFEIDSKLAAFRNQAGSGRIPFTVNVDTFHHAYMQFSESFIWPSVNLSKVDYPEADHITDLLLKYTPSSIQNCQILPDPRSGRYSNHLFYVRVLTEKPVKLLYIFRVSCQYMGGADSGEILKPARQGFSPEIRTDRIYYTSRILPVESLVYEDGHITDFKPFKLKDAVFQISNQNNERDMWSTILFDEVDFTSVNRRFTELFGFGEPWNAERMFLPFVIDSLSIAANLLITDADSVSMLAEKYASLLHDFLAGFSTDTVGPDTADFWKKYYTGWKYERILSRSGNPHWQLISVPEILTGLP